MKIILISLLTVPLLFSCATSKTKLSDAGKNVRILDSAKNNGCDVVDKVVGMNEKGSPALAKNHARNLAAEAGGDAIYFDEVIQNGYEFKVHATAFLCNKED